ncbi:MAG TPA: hypothetical protein VEI04_00865 [Syntrophobacteria bacterium]|nr:hypothetical protein [Syntrophobacteria bacterium]
MIITTSDGSSFDTDKDLTAPERHILQKLFLWEAMAASTEQFRAEKAKAFQRGWDKSGPLAESSVMRIITADMEKRLMTRLQEKTS